MTWRNSEGRGDFRQFYLLRFDVCPLSGPISIPYLVLIARKIYSNPEISLAGLNIILHKRMEVGDNPFDDKTKLRAFWSAEWAPS